MLEITADLHSEIPFDGLAKVTRDGANAAQESSSPHQRDKRGLLRDAVFAIFTCSRLRIRSFVGEDVVPFTQQYDEKDKQMTEVHVEQFSIETERKRFDDAYDDTYSMGQA